MEEKDVFDSWGQQPIIVDGDSPEYIKDIINTVEQIIQTTVAEIRSLQPQLLADANSDALKIDNEFKILIEQVRDKIDQEKEALRPAIEKEDNQELLLNINSHEIDNQDEYESDIPAEVELFDFEHRYLIVQLKKEEVQEQVHDKDNKRHYEKI